MNRIFIFAAMVMLLSACATAGKEIKPEELSEFKKGKTTVEQVVAKLGDPTTASISDGGVRTLTYTFSHYQMRATSFIPYVGLFAGGADVRANSVVFTFGTDGRMTSYRTTQSQTGITSGLMAGAQGGTPQPNEWQPLTHDDPSQQSSDTEPQKQSQASEIQKETRPKLESAPPTQIFDTNTEIEQTVRAWATAWSSKNTDRYIEFYSEKSFIPEKFPNRDAWKAQRYRAIKSAGSIRVTLSDLQVIVSDAGHAQATFTQDYRSDSHQDTGRKTLSLQKEGGAWKIVREEM
ncbi:MAG: nuclear transport factor 2 family protein [Magnetococcus sp. YQC-3]